MAVAWTPHRFTGGVLALDVTNTVVLRGDHEKSFDRFADPLEIARFAEAAAGYRAAELGGRSLSVADAAGIHSLVVEIRETTDRLFRDAVIEGSIRVDALADFLGATSKALRGRADRVSHPARPFGDAGRPMPFEAALAVSALSLLPPERHRRVRICRNCRWLFLDRSRNSSRLWCDMSICGNRNKARRHYQRRRAVLEDAVHGEH
jgi:predicted RNA-binding Zn ribbon-like protein